jgi:hypothetical protein
MVRGNSTKRSGEGNMQYKHAMGKKDGITGTGSFVTSLPAGEDSGR